jgi:hypothetical protein
MNFSKLSMHLGSRCIVKTIDDINLPEVLRELSDRLVVQIEVTSQQLNRSEVERLVAACNLGTVVNKGTLVRTEATTEDDYRYMGMAWHKDAMILDRLCHNMVFFYEQCADVDTTLFMSHVDLADAIERKLNMSKYFLAELDAVYSDTLFDASIQTRRKFFYDGVPLVCDGSLKQLITKTGRLLPDSVVQAIKAIAVEDLNYLCAVRNTSNSVVLMDNLKTQHCALKTDPKQHRVLTRYIISR